MRTIWAGSLAIVASLISSVALGQSFTALPPNASSQADLAARLNQLEAETQALRAEVARLRETPTRLPSVPMTQTGMMVAPAPDVPAAASLSAPVEPEEYYTLNELRNEMKKFAWRKGEFSIVPYGWLWGNSVYSTERTSPGSYTLFVQSASTQPESEFITDARNTRLGIDIGGPDIPLFCDAHSGGKIEVDFQNSVLSTENKATMMLRHAYAEVKNEDFRLLVGQTWDVISPLNPGMLMYSVGWDGGNIGYRRAQFRAERYWAFSDVSLLTAQFSFDQTVFPDGTTTIVGEAANWPILEGRTGWTIGERGKGCLPITVGLSGHIGNVQSDYTGAVLSRNEARRTWSGNIDVRIPLTDRCGIQGELFTGENLAAFLGGIGQGINPITRETIRSTGGWFELWYDWTPRLHSHAGYSLDDPNDNDLATGQKSYNQFFWGNLSYDITKQLLVGLEVSSWKTIYVDRRPGDSVRTEFVVKYGF